MTGNIRVVELLHSHSMTANVVNPVRDKGLLLLVAACNAMQ